MAEDNRTSEPKQVDHTDFLETQWNFVNNDVEAVQNAFQKYFNAIATDQEKLNFLRQGDELYMTEFKGIVGVGMTWKYLRWERSKKAWQEFKKNNKEEIERIQKRRKTYRRDELNG